MSALGWLAAMINAFAALAMMMLTQTQASVSTTPDGGLTADALRRGGYVIFIRHATANQGTDAVGFDLADCATQRNLGDAGIRESQAIGQGVRAQRIPIGMVQSSEFCRAVDTARLAFGHATPVSELNLCCLDGRNLTEQDRRDFLLRALATRPQPGANTVLVGHAAFMMTDLGMGEAGVYAPDGAGGFTRVARILPDEWTNDAYRPGGVPLGTPQLAPNP